MINFFKRKVERLKYPMQMVYKDKHGYKWYMFINPQEMPPERMWRAAFYTRYAELNLTPERLKLLSNNAYQALNSSTPRVADAVAFIHEILLAQELYSEEKTLMDLATVYVIGEDESVWEMSESEREKKKAMWQKDRTALSFFLSTVYNSILASSKNSEFNILNYLEQTRMWSERNPYPKESNT